MSRAIRQELAILVILALFLGGCDGRGANQNTVTISPYLALLRSYGLDLPDDTQITQVFDVELDGEHFEVLRYTSDAGNGLQIKHGDTLLEDADIAFRVLLSYAWTPQYHGVEGADVASLRALQTRLQNARQEYDAFFTFAESLAPLMEKIDELKDRQITGIPIITLGKFTLIDITNWWDLICTIPLDIFDLCLLEPLLREVHEQGLEIAQLLDAASEDLLLVVSQLEAQANGQLQDGLRLKESVERTISRLDNLLWKLDEFENKVATLQSLTQEAIWVLENREWGTKVETVVSALERAAGADSRDLIDRLLLPLRDLDQKMTGYLTKADEISADIEASLAILMFARVRTDDALQTLGEEWRTRPESRYSNPSEVYSDE